VSRELTYRGIEHLILERGRVAESWRRRWDRFCLVTPNWSVRLPGDPYRGEDPDGYLPRDDLVAFLERYAEGFDAPVREGVDVTAAQRDDDGFGVTTSSGDLRANRVVVATGAYQRPFRPRGAAGLPEDLLQIDVGGYTNEPALPPGRVLIVGSGQSGCQIAEELHRAEREVVLSCGRAPWAARRVAGRDVFWWVTQSGFMDQSLESLPDPSARLGANILASGHDGGHDLHLRTLQSMGVTLTGRFLDAERGVARFADDLADSVARGDELHVQLMDLFRATAATRGIPFDDEPDPVPLDTRSPQRLPLTGFGAVIFTGGFRPDYSWLPWPDAFDAMGFPIHHDGESTVVPGLHFIGVHFLRTRKSSLLFGVGEDAAVVAESIAGA
jgi:putative flavoprotein involved in K+ transport